MMVEMGTDRLHHGFWQYYDHGHPDYEPGTAVRAGVPRLLPHLDSEIGALLEGLADDTTCWSSPTTAPSAWTAASRERVADPRGLPVLHESAPAGAGRSRT